MRSPNNDDPARIGPYAVLAELGAGGMGQVYLGRSAGGRLVAIKVVRSEFADEPGFRQRFRREADAARKVSGFFTAPVIDADTEGPLPWLATTYIAGPSLGEAVGDIGAMPEPALRALGAGLAEALVAIHATGLVHRDLKPGNVLLAADGPRVIDFGISKALDGTRLTRTGGMVGTPAYMSPEQVASGRRIGPASDVFSLGGVLVFAATGSGPFGSGGAPDVLYRVVHGEPALDGVPGALRGPVAACLDKDPGRRPSPGDLVEALAPVEPSALISPRLRADLDRRARDAAAMAAATPAPAGAPPRTAPVAPSEGTATGLPVPSRRRFLRVAAGAAGGLGLTGAGVTAWAADAGHRGRRPAPTPTALRAAPAPAWTARPGAALEQETLMLHALGNTVVWGDAGGLRGYETGAGTLLWSQDATTVLKTGQGGAWARVLGSTAYAAADLFTDGSIVAGMEISNGRPAFRVHVRDARVDDRGQIVYADVGGVLILSASPYTSTGGDGDVCAARKSTGRVLWSHRLHNPLGQWDMAADERACYIGEPESVSAVGLTGGEARWKKDLVKDIGGASPRLTLAGGTLLAGAKGLMAFDTVTGTRRWTALAGDEVSRPAVVGQNVIAAAGNTISCVDLASGQVRWRTPSPSDLSAGATGTPSDASAAPVDGVASPGIAAVPFDAGLHVVGFHAKNPSGFLVVDAAGGAARWAYRTAPGRQWHVAASGNTVYSTDGSTLYAHR